jgi:hypothetical protein
MSDRLINPEILKAKNEYQKSYKELDEITTTNVFEIAKRESFKTARKNYTRVCLK